MVKVFFFVQPSFGRKIDLSEQLNVKPMSKIELVIFLCLSKFRQLSCNRHFYKMDALVKQTPRVGPCLSLPLLVDYL